MDDEVEESGTESDLAKRQVRWSHPLVQEDAVTPRETTLLARGGLDELHAACRAEC